MASGVFSVFSFAEFLTGGSSILLGKLLVRSLQFN
jgi:hypothetical protein